MKTIKYFFEFISIIFLFFIFKIIGLKNASNLGGAIGKYFGPLFRSKTTTIQNIKIAFGEIDKNKEINEIFGELEGWDTDWALPRNGVEDDAGEDDSSEEKDGGEEKDNNGEEEQKEEHAVATLDGEEKLSDALHRVTPEV